MGALGRWKWKASSDGAEAAHAVLCRLAEYARSRDFRLYLDCIADRMYSYARSVIHNPKGGPVNEFAPAEPTNKARAVIFKQAEEYARSEGFEPGDRIESLVAGLGGRLTYLRALDSMEAIDGSLFVRGPRDFEIKLSAFTGPERDRFTIAHELGHYVLHSECGKRRIKAERFGTSLVEVEANWFAAAFLMPEHDFKETCELYGNNASAVASRYMVSRKAAEVRMESLKIKSR